MSKLQGVALVSVLLIVLLILPEALLEAARPTPKSGPASVVASIETEPVPSAGDAADDIAVWIHPNDPSRSLVIGTDKLAGIAVYNLSGKQLQYRTDGRMNNVDLRYNFSLGSEQISLVIASNVSRRGVSIYKIDEAAQQLIPLLHSPDLGMNVYGLCMYRGSTAQYFFLTEAEIGVVQQWRVDGTTGSVSLSLERVFETGSQAEGCVADDEHGYLYIAEEDVGIWRYDARPNGDTSRVLIDSIGSGGKLVADVEGLAIYYGSAGKGYLLASSQGNSTYTIYDRQTGAHAGTFVIAAGNGIDATEETDGIDVTNSPLGAAFPQGMFVAQDSKNNSKGKSVANQNFKLVPWQAIANAFTPPLLIDTTWDPRSN
jgi:myo-inositol-hexaphosphate 3-phosphohydrolase